MAHQHHTEVVKFDDNADQTIDQYRHADTDGGHHQRTRHQVIFLNNAQRDNDDFGGEDEICADRAFNFCFFVCDFRFGIVSVFIFIAVQEFVQQFFHAFKTQIHTADHQQGRNQRRQESGKQQRKRHQNQLVDQRAFCHRPNNRQFALGRYAGYLIGVERQIVTDHTGGFFGGDFGHHRYIVQNGGNVVQKRKERGEGHNVVRIKSNKRAIIYENSVA